MSLEITESWPAALPLPKIDYSGNPNNASLASQPASPAIVRRSRFYRSYSSISVQWTMTDAELEVFKEFFIDNLGCGCAQFLIELRFPINTALEIWSAKFVGGYEALRDGGFPTAEDSSGGPSRFWYISAQLDLVHSNVDDG